MGRFAPRGVPVGNHGYRSFATGAFLATVLVCLSVPSVAADESGSRLSRAEAIDLALDRNLDLRIALEEVERARGTRLVRRAPGVPSVSVSGSYELRDRALIDRAPDDFGDRDPETVDPPPDSEVPISRESVRLRGEIRQLLFAGFEQYFRGRASDEELRSAVLRARNTANNVVRDVRVAFERVLWIREAVASREKTLANARRLEELVRGRAAGGQAIEYEIARARINRSRAEVDLKRERIRLEEAVSRLADRIGLSSERRGSLEVEGRCRPLVGELPAFPPVEEALAGNWRVRSLDSAIEAARHSVRSEQASLSPRVEGYANYQYNSSYYDFGERLHGWAAGVAVRWDLFDGFARRGRVRSSLAEKRSAEWERRSFVSSFERAYANVRDELARSREILEAETDSLALAEESLGQVRELFERGRIDVEPVVRNENQVLEARLRRAEAVFRLNSAWFQYESLLGVYRDKISRLAR